MQLMKKNKINFGELKIISFIMIISILILWFILMTYIKYFNINSNYAFTTILRQNYIPSFDGENFNKSKEIFLYDLKNVLGINLLNPLSILGKEINIMKATDIEDKDLFSNIYNQEEYVEDTDKTYVETPSETKKIKILIYHTHTTEAFKPANNDSFYEEYSVVGVGDVLKKELERNYNMEVIHDKTIHNISNIESYKRSGETLEKYLNEIDDFDLILDLHRDALENKNLVTTQIDGKKVAKIMFVVAKNNPNYLENEELAVDLTNLANFLYPDFARSVFYYPKGIGAFNQNKSSKLALVEIGAQLNTVEEALNSAKLLANVIGEYFIKE